MTTPTTPEPRPVVPAPSGGETGEAITYATAGVDTEAGDRAVELMRSAVQRTLTPEVLGGFGGFAGLVDASALKDYGRPLLATSTDGVGTKIAIARAMGVHDTIGQDLVAMVVDDIVVVGAKPLLMTDYIACGKVEPTRIADIVRGIAAACEIAGVPLLGGETAEHPGLMAPDEYDVAGAATGVVDAEDVLGPERVRDGDVLLAMASSGLHSNGYSLVRRVVDAAGWALDRDVPELGRTLGEELLEPTALYTRPSLDLAGALGADLHAFTHVTGGGLAANLARVLPAGLVAGVDRGSWAVPPIFGLLQGLGRVPWDDLEGTLNLGVGMVAVLAADRVDEAMVLLADADVPSWVIGEIALGDGSAPDGARVVSGTKGVDGGAVHLTGNYRPA
ncbi:phosphoribosylformylglycinamidine cyclo-ligase [Georgenia sp. Z1344]|uniref:phosphoribosylformylglycinamidine cyclo-ligase n=1 Tax=Georgenia sp. Z1344 TaxID=3416706 RepID=UPI003CEB9BB6